ncbi:helix-turn-helix domain-containing protein [Undibacterium fentianense]|uniref:Helix-turn-helix transcriptional regulator n=1 Tax=Undibacterium fentianense TaxID=2828728 RepID=A0A941ICQ7_9BURK|nr:helix-turn-helix transcriptional regulator [Undibacterium fentianense]MBR7799143.1 helix-turn-helix transcriptional regulator [Undibacterium fentianense]
MPQEEISPEKQLAREVGQIIATRRKAMKFTQAELAERMEIEKETVSRIETGHIAPTLARLAQIAKLLDCEISDLLKISTPDVSDRALALMNRMENLSDGQQTILLDLFGKVALAMGKLNAKDRKVVERFLGEIL